MESQEIFSAHLEREKKVENFVDHILRSTDHNPFECEICLAIVEAFAHAGDVIQEMIFEN